MARLVRCRHLQDLRSGRTQRYIDAVITNSSSSPGGLPALDDANVAPGKRRLIEAALRLAAARRSFASLGIRELAREAELNPNTFYRHFGSIDDLALETIMLIGARLRPMLHSVRDSTARQDPAHVASRAVEAFFAFALDHRDAFVIGIAEYHGASERVRAALRTLLDEIAREMADDVQSLRLAPGLARERLDEVCAQIVVHLFHVCHDYLEDPARRARVLAQSERFVIWLLTGALLNPDARPVAQG
jgi:AcrR family transcriptional regulator